MSLINKMLQDLDARGGQPGPAAVSPEIKTVLPPERGFPWLRVALLGALVVVLGGSGYAAWRFKQTAPEPVPTPAPALVAAPLVQVPAPAPVAPAPEPEPEPVPVVPAPAPEPIAVVEKPAPAPKKVDKPVKKEAPAPRRAVVKAEPVKAPAKAAAPVRTPAPAKASASAGRVETPVQRAENGYNRALASLEDGRMTEAIGHLQGALRADPRHEASRQTLVSLLIEAKRPDEAMKQLQAALALDPRQPSLAMLLARLQIERGGPGIETLLRTLPHAAGNGEYHAFLAGALQREQRHREAADHYTAALRTSPHNGVWWMGLGMSLQAEKRNAEAADAYQKARASGTLSAELQGFVERKLKQLAK
ncbi:tetratricopeptide repeat protein [Massilia yuzhufengensis]|uniref:MSHA biogenesis protein MshN n=1 Tax=Massilia yuzhufengensis TaxID=1164594 RepID=A0A1I1WPC5_9BURK|nr:tetratricopeptide repeat protein [Massilia yuzhufengensis]SFD95273.1 MSHA biogenesis protein MshN [Massilia yuzhufengensis]